MRIRWTEPAAQDFTSICDYIREHDGPEEARKAALRIYEGISALLQFPRRGRPGVRLILVNWSSPGCRFSRSVAFGKM